MESGGKLCSACGGYHNPDSLDTWVDYEGYRFKPPFRCMCCGKVICARQFAFGRCCSSCDTGACDPRNRAFRIEAVHPQPAWYSQILHRDEQIREFAIAVNASKIHQPDEQKHLGKAD